MSRLALCSLSISLLLAAPAARADRQLSLDDAIKLALARNPELTLERSKVEEAEATRKSTRGLYGPKLMVDANLMVWDSALAFEFSQPDMSKMDTPTLAILAKYGDLMSVLPSLFDLGNIRDQVTAQIGVTLAQPLTPLLQIHNGYKATREMAEAARLDEKSKELDVAHKVSETYFQVLQAQRFAEVAQTGVEQVEAHLARARHFYTAGLIGKQDVLKAQLELARARERVIKAKTGISLATSALALQLGLGLGEKLTLTERVEDPPPEVRDSLGQALETALRKRTELRAMEHKQRAARAGRRRAKWDMIPQVSAVATYQYTRGQGTFFPENAFFAGGVLKWEVWDWGNKYYAMKAAALKERQAELGRRLLRDGVQIQTKKAFLELQQSGEALAVARAAIAEAEENFRIEKQRFDANANTSTDVLDAQLALTRAQLSYTTALYGYYIARAALLRSTGRLELNR